MINMENFKLAFDLTDKSKIQVQLNKYGAVCFWQEFKKHGYLSQWFSGVISDGLNEKPQFTGVDLFDKSEKTFSFYNCEQYMMFQKASLFKYKEFIVYQGNLLKFSANEELKTRLLNTGNKVLIETSPFDVVYGIGLDYYGRDLNKQQFDLLNVDDWKGSNLLGFALMQVRDKLK